MPTYGYVVAFDREGRFVGLSAEGPLKSWPAGTQLKEVRADPEAMAKLVQEWTRNRPASCQGLIWYRLPIFGESLNWHWPTLSVVMSAKVPHPDVRAVARYPKPALVEIELINAGDADHFLPVQAAIRWRDARIVASDGLAGFESAGAGDQRIVFKQGNEKLRLAPGERRTIGWVRFNKETEVQSELLSE